MNTTAVILSGPKTLALDELALNDPGPTTSWSRSRIREFPPGPKSFSGPARCRRSRAWATRSSPATKSAGEVVEAGADTDYRAGDRVFVPGANCYEGAFGLFGGRRGGSSRRRPRDESTPGSGAEGALLALAATARHAMAGLDKAPPDLIVGPWRARAAARAADASPPALPRRPSGRSTRTVDGADRLRGDPPRCRHAPRLRLDLRRLRQRGAPEQARSAISARAARSCWPGSTPRPSHSPSRPPS